MKSSKKKISEKIFELFTDILDFIGALIQVFFDWH